MIVPEILKCYQEKFSTQPRLFFSPGRINIIGEHIDYNDGYVLPAAIDKGVYYAIAANNSDDIHFRSFDFNEEISVKITSVERSEGWKNYVLSVVNEFLLLKKNIRGFDCVFGGDIPRGSGMSSSAAVEGGLAFALNEIFSCGLTRIELAQLCQRAEHNFPNVKCGIMDQFANMMGQKGHVIMLDCKTLAYQHLPLDLEGYKIVLMNTKVHHSLASGEYNIRRKRCEEGLALLKEKLGVHSFRDIKDVAGIEPFKDVMEPAVYDCCKYVVEEIGRTQQAAVLLQQNNIAELGRLMYATHYGLSRLYKVSCPELDFLVDKASEYINVIGSRVMGGGFGGCTINIVKDEAVDDFIQRVGKDYQKQFGINPEAYITNTFDGTREEVIG